jgi:hypothetical protein
MREAGWKNPPSLGETRLASGGGSTQESSKNRRSGSQPQPGAGPHFRRSLGLPADSRIGEELKAAGVPMSSDQALEALRTMHVVNIRVGGRNAARSDRRQSSARQILAALGISDREPAPDSSIIRENARLSDKVKIQCLIFNNLQISLSNIG